MNSISDYISLCRPYQWYKNLLVYLALIFSKMLFEPASFVIVTITFISVSLISSAGYILNDIIDRKYDRLHPEKRSRPVASGRVAVPEAFILSAILMIISLSLAFSMSYMLGLLVTMILLLTLIYSFALKDEPIADAVIISVNHVLRAVAGAVVLHVFISPWLITCTFSLALLLVFSKRRSEQIFLGRKAAKHRPVQKYYPPAMTSSMIYVASALFIMSYVLYSSFMHDLLFLLTVPFLVYGVFYYIMLVESGSPAGRRSHLVFADPRMLFSIISFTAIVMVMLYV